MWPLAPPCQVRPSHGRELTQVMSWVLRSTTREGAAQYHGGRSLGVAVVPGSVRECTREPRLGRQAFQRIQRVLLPRSRFLRAETEVLMDESPEPAVGRPDGGAIERQDRRDSGHAPAGRD